MLTLDQIRLLERKVNAAVTRIAALREENSLLEGKLGKALDKIDELEARIDRFKDDQAEIEQGILSALGQLDKLEDIAAAGDDDDLDDADAFEGVPSDASPGEAVKPAVRIETADTMPTGQPDTSEEPESDDAHSSDETESGASDELDIF